MKIKKILIANRGDTALQIIKKSKTLGIITVCVYSKIDINNAFVHEADIAVCIGLNKLSSTYLDCDKLIQVAVSYNCDALHPGIGFLSENYEFASKVRAAGLIFIGPRTELLNLLGNKNAAKRHVRSLGIPTLIGNTETINHIADAKKTCAEIGFPVIFKSENGGGGKGIRIIHNELEIENYFEFYSKESINNFGLSGICIEKYKENMKHIEVQIVGDNYGNIVHLYERECSIQRKHQKIIEESPCARIGNKLKSELICASLKIGHSIHYNSLGTVEFLVDIESNEFYFIELNARLQVEHLITEKITGIDIIETQIKISENNMLDLSQKNIQTNGYAIECRICAEDIHKHYLPSPGYIDDIKYDYIPNVQFYTELCSGYYVSPYYDSMLGRIICYAENRNECIKNLIMFLEKLKISGVKTNSGLLLAILSMSVFENAYHTSTYLDKSINQICSLIKKKSCPECGKYTSDLELKKSNYTCKCGYLYSMRALHRIDMLCDKGSFINLEVKIDKNIIIDNDYKDKLVNAKKYAKINEAVIIGKGSINYIEVMLAVMDNHFMMGSMGYVVGERITCCIEKAIDLNLPLIIFSTSGGARMQEGIISLLQMEKICASLKRFKDKGNLYISCLTNPTMGGVTASFALLGDINIAEPHAQIGFAGPRVIADTLHEKLPINFQEAEMLLDRGFIDIITDRKNLKDLIYKLLDMHGYKEKVDEWNRLAVSG